MMGVKRVVSLLPSAAEIISLIVGNNPSVQLVGRSHEDDYPPSVTTLPILTAPKTKFTTTADVDVQVSNLLAEGNSLYTLDIALLKSLRPDIVITQNIKNINIKLILFDYSTAHRKTEPIIVTLNPLSIEDVISSISDVGKALEMIEESSRAISMLRSRINHARDLVNQSIASGRKRSKVAFFEWTSPIYLGGHWTPQLIRWSNGIQVLADCKDGDTAEMGAPPSVRVPPEDIIREKPEILIVCPCGLNLDATRKEYEETLLPSNWWPPLAKYASKIALVDGNQMFNRSGPRLVDALEWLVGYINDIPEVIPKNFPWENLKS
ncbi:helical backbone metal receptor [Gigaspora margarita]|uniref:Helical backbone metal receptor n=1 Tax=Gigaspora margarita TaxID=4874 RepID=A0A8H4AM34_GIGMA|nr:helical backbone metal receptor [Gigaspora margarita]